MVEKKLLCPSDSPGYGNKASGFPYQLCTQGRKGHGVRNDLAFYN